MTKHVHTQNFRPWFSNLIWSFYGLVFVWLAWRFLFQRGHVNEFLVALAICSGFTVWQWKTFIKRMLGQSIERKAINALRKILDKTKECAMSSSVPLDGGGDADAVVVLSGQKFNIEIKSVQDSKLITAKHAEQAAKAAWELHSTPVIWLPKASIIQVKDKNHVRIFGGDAKALVKHLESLK